MKKVNVLFIMDIETHFYDHGLSKYQIDVYKKAHQCDLAIQVPISQPLDNIEYPRFEVHQFDAKEASFIDAYKQQISYMESRVKDLGREVNSLKRDASNKVDGWYKVLFYTSLIVFLSVLVILHFKL